MCTKKYFKLAIMDLMMPVMDGFEATERILEYQKEHHHGPPNSQCDIIALTSNTDNVTLDRCKKIGFKEVLNKPLEFESLKRLACIYHYKMTQEEYLAYLEYEKKIEA